MFTKGEPRECLKSHYITLFFNANEGERSIRRHRGAMPLMAAWRMGVLHRVRGGWDFEEAHRDECVMDWVLHRVNQLDMSEDFD